MANGKIRFGKQSGGELALAFPDGVDNTEVLLPESGELATKEYIDNTTVKLTGDQTIEDTKTFTSSPIVPTPTTDFQVTNKQYVDSKTLNINSLSDKPTPINTDNFVLQEAGGDLKKVSYKNLFDKVSITGSATFNGTTQTIDLTGIGDITLAIGDVIEVIGTTSNNKLFTVESIPNANQIVVNYEHRGASTPVPSKRLISETANATIKLYNRAKDAPLGQGQGWCFVASVRVPGTLYTNNTNKPIALSVCPAPNSAAFIQADSVVISSANSGGSWLNTATAVIPSKSLYSVNVQAGSISWHLELR